MGSHPGNTTSEHFARWQGKSRPFARVLASARGPQRLRSVHLIRAWPRSRGHAACASFDPGPLDEQQLSQGDACLEDAAFNGGDASASSANGAGHELTQGQPDWLTGGSDVITPHKNSGDAAQGMLAAVRGVPALGRGPAPEGGFSRHEYDHPAAGWGSAMSVSRVLEKAGEPIDGFHAIFVMNHEDGGFDCPGCAWPDDPTGLRLDLCEEGIKHVT
jgi:hypothetical protein